MCDVLCSLSLLCGVQFFKSDVDTSIALSTFTPLVTNLVDPKMLLAEPTLDTFLKSVVDENGDVIAASVNAGYIDFAMNWLCSISKMNIRVS